MATRSVDENTKLRSLGYSDMLGITTLLDFNDGWKDMIGHIRDSRTGAPRYNMIHVGLFNRQPSPSASLLNDWMTSNATVGNLLSVLEASRLLLVMEHVTVNVIRKPPPPLAPRPDYGETNGNRGFGVHAATVTPSVSDETSPSVVPVEDSTHSSGASPNSLQYWQLRSMCSGFDESPAHSGGRLLGRGGFGSVYLGIANDGRKYAVKKLNCSQESVKQAALQFERELQVLSSCRHQNLLALVEFVRGSSVDSNCIVYEFMENGSLEDRLARKGGTEPLIAGLRVSIAVGAAAGIAYLHAFREPSPIVHRDIKSANILLDSQFVAKVGDFGLAKLLPEDVTNVMTGTVIGTTCYMPPESLQFKVTPKWDVYSFGVVLLEIITGLPAMDSNREERSLYRHVLENIDDDDIMPLADGCASWSANAANDLYKIAIACLASDYHDRPDITQVQQLLGGVHA